MKSDGRGTDVPRAPAPGVRTASPLITVPRRTGCRWQWMCLRGHVTVTSGPQRAPGLALGIAESTSLQKWLMTCLRAYGITRSNAPAPDTLRAGHPHPPCAGPGDSLFCCLQEAPVGAARCGALSRRATCISRSRVRLRDPTARLFSAAKGVSLSGWGAVDPSHAERHLGCFPGFAIMDRAATSIRGQVFTRTRVFSSLE